VPLKDGWPTQDDRYNCRDESIHLSYPHRRRKLTTPANGGQRPSLLEGYRGGGGSFNAAERHGSRSKIIKSNPLPKMRSFKIYKGKKRAPHGNFLSASKTPHSSPISDCLDPPCSRRIALGQHRHPTGSADRMGRRGKKSRRGGQRKPHWLAPRASARVTKLCRRWLQACLKKMGTVLSSFPAPPGGNALRSRRLPQRGVDLTLA